MAGSRIKGVTVEIGGDTVKLTSALKDVDKQLGTTQSSLKDVNRLLKLDPGNTELLSQKQKLLKEAVGETKDRLEQLNEALRQAESTDGYDSVNMDALKREIVDTENKLKDLEAQADRSSVAVGKIADAGGKLKNVGEGTERAGKALTAGLTVPIAAAGTAAVKTAADFEASMSQVEAVSGASGEEMRALEEKARQMGATTKFSASEAADAMNYMGMAGWKSGQMIAGIEGIMNLAAASGEDLATTSDIVTDGLTAFGMAAEQSGELADVMAAASSNANTNVSMLGESFKYVAPVAGSMGYTCQDTAIALGLMANAGVKASQGGTSLRSIMSRLAAPTKEVDAAMSALGLSIQNDDGTMKSFREVMDDLRAAFANSGLDIEEYTQKMAALDQQLSAGEITQKQYESAAEDLANQAFSASGALNAQYASAIAGKNGMSGLLAIVGASEADYDKLCGAVDGASDAIEYNGQVYEGTAAKMAAVMQDNLPGQITILKSALEELAISFGKLIMPTVKAIVEKLQEFVGWLNSLSDGTKQMIVRIAAVAAAIGPLLVVAGKLMIGVGTLMEKAPAIAEFFGKISKGIGKLKAVISGIGVGPLLGIVAAVAAIGGSFATLWATNEDFRNNIVGTWTQIKDKVAGFCDGIVERINKLGFNFTDITDVIKAIWKEFCDFMAPIFEGVFSQIANTVDYYLDLIMGVIDTFTALFTGDWDGFWNGLKGIAENFWDYTKKSIENATGIITGIIKEFLSWFGIEWNGTLGPLKEVWETFWTDLQQLTSGLIDGLREVFAGFADLFNGDWEGFCSHLSKAWETSWNGIKKFGGDIWDGIKKLWEPIGQWFGQKWGELWNGVSTFFSDIWKDITDACSNTWEGIKKTASDFWHTFADPVAEAWEAVKNAVWIGIQLISSIINAAWQIITLPFAFIWENCKETVMTVWEAIKIYISEAWEAIKTKAEEIFGPIRDFLTEVWTAISEKATELWEIIKHFFIDTWNSIKQTAEEIFTPIRDFIIEVWTTVQTTVTDIWNAITQFFSDTWNGIKTNAENIFNGARDAVNNAFQAVRDKVTEIWNGIKQFFSDTWNSIKTTASNIFNGIKDAITGPIETAKNIIKGIVDTIKGFFDNFHISLPHIKLPHFAISPPGWNIGDLLHGSIPSLGIEWYKEGGILDGAQVFGMNGNNLLAGGEAGKEAVLPLSDLWKQMGKMFEANSPDLSTIERLMSALLQNSGSQVIVLDSGALVGELAPRLNNAFARIETQEGRR